MSESACPKCGWIAYEDTSEIEMLQHHFECKKWERKRKQEQKKREEKHGS